MNRRRGTYLVLIIALYAASVAMYALFSAWK